MHAVRIERAFVVAEQLPYLGRVVTLNSCIATASLVLHNQTKTMIPEGATRDFQKEKTLDECAMMSIVRCVVIPASLPIPHRSKLLFLIGMDLLIPNPLAAVQMTSFTPLRKAGLRECHGVAPGNMWMS